MKNQSFLKKKKRQIQLNVSLNDCVDYKEGKELLHIFPWLLKGKI